MLYKCLHMQFSNKLWWCMLLCRVHIIMCVCVISRKHSFSDLYTLYIEGNDCLYHHRFCRARYACPCMFFSTLYHNYICTCSHLSHAHCHSFQILIMETEYRLIYTSIRYEVQFSELVVLTNVYYHQV